MRKLKEQRASRSCRQIGKVDRETLQDLAYRLNEALKGAPPKIPASGVPVMTRYGRSLNRILLALGYEASLVGMLGRRYGS